MLLRFLWWRLQWNSSRVPWLQQRDWVWKEFKLEPDWNSFDPQWATKPGPATIWELQVPYRYWEKDETNLLTFTSLQTRAHRMMIAAQRSRARLEKVRAPRTTLVKTSFAVETRTAETSRATVTTRPTAAMTPIVQAISISCFPIYFFFTTQETVISSSLMSSLFLANRWKELWTGLTRARRRWQSHAVVKMVERRGRNVGDIMQPTTMERPWEDPAAKIFAA